MNCSLSKVSKSLRIADQHLEGAIFFRERNDRVFAGDRFGHEFDHRRRNRDVVQVVVFVAVELGEGLGDLFAVGVAELDDGVLQLEPPRLGDGLRLLELFGTDDPLLDEKVPESIGHGGVFSAASSGSEACGSARRTFAERPEKGATTAAPRPLPSLRKRSARNLLG